ncbi:MAG: aminoglycoside phosphotransferase family protein [Actinomycetota bacterium]|nr:aminoglycoside phosphotransferase family protein [Actinomycetota bacterium]
MTDASTQLGDDRPYLQRTQPLPRRLEEVTPAWLGEMLAHRYPGVVVHDFETVEVKSSHTTKVRVRLDMNDAGRAAGIPEHVCLKANWSGMRTPEICELEARFYGLASSGLDVPVPAAYFADWDDDGWGNGIVVMEDLARSPGTFGSSDDHLGVDAVAAGLETLARVHGAMWGDPRLATWKWLHPNMGTANDTEQVIIYWNYIWFNLTDPEYRAVVPAWVYDRPELMAHALDALTAYERAATGTHCLVHGDAHQGNSFLRADGQRVWVDWQLVRHGTALRDVEYFLVSSLTVEERRANDRALVEHYRQSLLATGAEGAPGADEAWQQFIRWPAYGSQAWLGNINQWGQSSGVEMVKRHFAALEDYDTVGVLTTGKAPSRPFVPGEGAYRLSRQLQQQLDERTR